MEVRDRRARPARPRSPHPRSRRARSAPARTSRGVTRAGHRAGDEDLPVHCSPLRVAVCAERYPTAGCGIIRAVSDRAHCAWTAAPRSSPAAAARRASASPARSCWPELGAKVTITSTTDRIETRAGRAARRGRRRVTRTWPISPTATRPARWSPPPRPQRPARRPRQQRRARPDRRRDRGRALRASCPRSVPARPRAQPADRVPRHPGGAPGHARRAATAASSWSRRSPARS